MPELIPSFVFGPHHQCDLRPIAKKTRFPLPMSSIKCTRPFDLIDCNIWGPQDRIKLWRLLFLNHRGQLYLLHMGVSNEIQIRNPSTFVCICRWIWWQLGDIWLFGVLVLSFESIKIDMSSESGTTLGSGLDVEVSVEIKNGNMSSWKTTSWLKKNCSESRS